MIRTYTDLISINSYLGRFEYLKLGGSIGAETFGFDRHLNQTFYRSPEWKRFRREIIARDMGCDLAWSELEIHDRLIIVHHINPITPEDVLQRSYKLFDPENAVCVAEITHKAIHYGDASLLPSLHPIERMPNDTCPWR